MSIKKRLIKISIRFGIVMLLFWVIVIVSTLSAGYPPAKYLYTNESFDWEYTPEYNDTQFNIVFDHHSHTLYSDGHLTVEQNILWHLAHGFNAITISDHNTMENAEEIALMAEKYKDDIIFIPGLEWTTNRIHLNLIGITEEVLVPSNNPTDDEIKAAINNTHNQGGIVVVNHIPWSLPRMPDHPTRAQLLDWGVDYIEIVNGDEYDFDSEPWCNDTNGFGMITGTDMHDPQDVSCWTLLNADNLTAEGIMKELHNRNTTIIYDHHISLDHSIGTLNPVYQLFKPIVHTGYLFFNDDATGGFVDWKTVGITLSYVVLGFGIVEGAKFGTEKLSDKIRKNREDRIYQDYES